MKNSQIKRRLQARANIEYNKIIIMQHVQQIDISLNLYNYLIPMFLMNTFSKRYVEYLIAECDRFANGDFCLTKAQEIVLNENRIMLNAWLSTVK